MNSSSLGAVVQRYDPGMTTKIAVSLPDHLVEHARAAVADGKAASVSAYVAQALQDRLDQEPLSDFFAMFDAEFGPPAEEHDGWARDVLARADAEIAEKIARGIL